MTRPRLRDVKPDFLRFIDLLYYCRSQEVGKKGRTRINISELQKHLIGGELLKQFLTQLIEDEVIEALGSLPEVTMGSDGSFSQPNNEDVIVVRCLITKEQILAYRYTLTKTNNEQQIFNAPNWSVIQITVRDHKNILVSIAGTDTLDVPATYGTLGFANKRNGNPLKVWDFLLLLAKHRGNVLKNHVDIVNFGGDSDKHKQIVMKKLQKAFGIPDEDPFNVVARRNGKYHLKCALHVEMKQRLVEVTETSPFDEEMGQYS